MAATVADLRDTLAPFPRGGEGGVTPFIFTINLPTTSLDEVNDKVILFGPFPTGAYLGPIDLYVDDLDSNGTPTIVADLSYGDLDGTVDGDVITGINDPQAGGGDQADVSKANLALDVGGKYLIFHVTTAAATAQAGDIRVRGHYYAGTIAHSA